MILLINGEVGGVGKSTMTRLILEYFKCLKLENYRLFDLDVTKSDVGEMYDPTNYQQANNSKRGKGKKTSKSLGEQNSDSSQSESQSESIADRLIRFSDNRRDLARVDILFEEGRSKNVVANLPSNIKDSLDTWITENDLLGLAKQLDMKFINFFVITRQPNCVELFSDIVNNYGNDGAMQHVLCYNEKDEGGVSFDEFKQQSQKLRDLLKTYQDKGTPIVQMSIPVLNQMYYDEVLNRNLTFSGAVASEGGLPLITRSAIANFVRSSNQELKRVFQELSVDLHNPQAKQEAVEISLEV